MQVDWRHMDLIHHSTHAAPCLCPKCCSADGSSTIHPKFRRLELPLHFFLEKHQAMLMDSQWSFQYALLVAFQKRVGICIFAHSIGGLLQVQASPHSVRRMLHLLRDGDFLDELSSTLQGRFIVYNHPLETFATVELVLTRGNEGVFRGQVWFWKPSQCLCAEMSSLHAKSVHNTLSICVSVVCQVLQVSVLSAPATAFPLEHVHGQGLLISHVFFILTAAVHVFLGIQGCIQYLQDARTYKKLTLVCF